jgi:hypothetical protein
MYIMTPETIPTAYSINHFHQSVYLYVYPLSLLSNGSVKIPLSHSERATAATNTHATVEEILDTSFYMRSVP